MSSFDALEDEDLNEEEDEDDRGVTGDFEDWLDGAVTGDQNEDED